MENPSAIDMNIRNVDVRLNDSRAESNMNGDIDNSLYISTTVGNETQIKSVEDEKSAESISELSDDFREKLHVCKDSKNCGLINGCHKAIRDEMKLMDLTVNGVHKCNNIEIINSHLDKLNLRTSELSLNSDDNSRTNCKLIAKDQSLSDKGCLPSELSVSNANDCDDKLIANRNTEGVNSANISLDVSAESEILNDVNITYLGYDSEKQMPDIMRLIQKDLSEPYSIYTYRYFIHNWPKLCFLAQYGDRCVGAIVCKLDVHKKQSRRGYIAMLAVDEKYRKRKIGSNLVLKAIHAMVEDNADEVVLETEITNRPALKLYENLGFVRDKRLFRYYLNGVDALRLKLWLR